MLIKTRTIALIAALICSNPGSPLSAAEPAVWATIHNLTVAITLSYTVPATVVKDSVGKPVPDGGPASSNNYTVDTLNREGNVTKSVQTSEQATKQVTAKFGNVDVLKRMAQDWQLPPIGNQANPSPSGWSLIYVGNGSDTSGIGGSVGQFCARHAASKTIVPLNGFDFSYSSGGYANSLNLKSVVTTLFNLAADTSTQTAVYTGVASTKAHGVGHILYNDHSIALAGIFTETSTKVILKTETFPEYKISTPIWVPGAMKLDKVSGSARVPLPDDTDSNAVVEGTLSLSAGTVVDMNVFNPSTP